MMLTSLDLLVIVFMAMTAATLLAVVLMFLVKHPTVKKVSFWFLGIQGMILAVLNHLMTPMEFTGELALGWGLGGLSVAALLMSLLSKNEKTHKIARILVALAAVAGMVCTFAI